MSEPSQPTIAYPICKSKIHTKTANDEAEKDAQDLLHPDGE
jgi:hypothetical protein